jgi:hypothetical protein
MDVSYCVSIELSISDYGGKEGEPDGLREADGDRDPEGL